MNVDEFFIFIGSTPSDYNYDQVKCSSLTKHINKIISKDNTNIEISLGYFCMIMTKEK